MENLIIIIVLLFFIITVTLIVLLNKEITKRKQAEENYGRVYNEIKRIKDDVYSVTTLLLNHNSYSNKVIAKRIIDVLNLYKY